MPPRPNARNWNDVQTAIAAVAIVATLGIWNRLATPAKAKVIQTQEPVAPLIEPPVSAEPTRMPHVKIMFTQVAPQNTVVQQQQNITQNITKKKKNNQNNNGGGSVTQTKSS